MAYTLEQRLQKQQLLRADREISALLTSTRKIELEEKGVILWIFDRLIAYSKALAEAREAGKISKTESTFLFEADGVTRLFASFADFWHCLCETAPEMERLGMFDSMTEGKGLRLYDPAQESGARKGRSTAGKIISN